MIEVDVEQVMSDDVITVNKSQSLADAGEVMADAGIKSVVVRDSDTRPVGILTSTDFVQLAAAGNTPMETAVDEYMTHDIVTTSPETGVRDAADLMLEHNVSHLPVVDEDNRLAGIVTTTDVAVYVSGL